MRKLVVKWEDSAQDALVQRTLRVMLDLVICEHRSICRMIANGSRTSMSQSRAQKTEGGRPGAGRLVLRTYANSL